MKIITWNIQRLEKNKTGKIIKILEDENADIIILTETNSKLINLTDYHFCSTTPLPNNLDNINYKDGENRVSIFSKFPIIAQNKTWNSYTSVCADIETTFGLLTIYGTIIGILGGKGEVFKNELAIQILDFEKLSVGKNFCLAGDLNIMLSGYAYPSHTARESLNNFFDKNSINCVTSNIPKNVNHIAINNEFLTGKLVENKYWNEEKILSDHKGICISLTT
jgi:exonuclease III